MRERVLLHLSKDILCCPKGEKGYFEDWIYLDYSYKTFYDLKAIPGPSKLMEEIQERISDEANPLRRQYIEYLGEISQNNNSLSSKNIFLHHICFFDKR